MKFKFVKLLIMVSRLSKKMKSLSEELDGIYQLLKDPEITLYFIDKEDKPLTKEDYE